MVIDFSKLKKLLKNICEGDYLMDQLGNQALPDGLYIGLKNKITEFQMAQVRRIQEECRKLRKEYENEKAKLQTQDTSSSNV